MPSEFGYYYTDNSARIKAWQSHYEAKGCHPIKAHEVAHRKVGNSNTWPPETSCKKA